MNSVTQKSYNPKHHPLNYPICDDWQPLFKELDQKQWFQNLLTEISLAYEKLTIAPREKFLWRIFEITSLNSLIGIILGQDPYPNIQHANGLAFSVEEGITIPASLRSIFFELKRSHEMNIPSHGNLSGWAEQGIFLLNSTLVLNMETKKPPQNIDSELWTKLIQSIISYILKNKTLHPIFMLAMGKKAQKSTKAFLLADNLHIINTPHPSPLAAIGLQAKPFIGCGCFETIDKFLNHHNLKQIIWCPDAPSVHKGNHPHES